MALHLQIKIVGVPCNQCIIHYPNGPVPQNGHLLVHSHGGRQDAGLLRVVGPGSQPRGRGGGRLATVEERPPLLAVERAGGRSDAGLHEGPRAHVLGLLLAPRHCGVAVLGHLLSQLVPRERGQLLHPHHGHGLSLRRAALLALLQQLEVDLAGAEHQLAHLLRVRTDGRVALAEEPHELGALAHLGQRGGAAAVPEQVLGRHHDERLPEVAVDLAPQHVVVVGRRGAVHHLPVAGLDLHAGRLLHGRHHVGVLVHLLQEPLQATGAVLGALPHVAVRQQHGEAALAQPLVLACRDELVDHDLRAVHEVAELRLPQHQRVGVLQRVAHLEAQHAELRQDGVAHGELGLHVGGGGAALAQRQRRRGVLGQVVERHELVAGALVHDDGVAVREGASLHVLAAQPHVVALQQQRAEGQCLGRGPVQALAPLDGVQAGLHDLHQLLVCLQRLGQPAHLGAHLLQPVHGHTRLADAGQLPGRQEAAPLGAQPVMLGCLPRLGGLEFSFQCAVDHAADVLQRLLAAGALRHQLRPIHGQRVRVLVDLLVQARLRVHGLVQLVVAVAAVADHVHDAVVAELLAVLHGHLEGGHHGQRVVPVAVEDGYVEGLGQVGGVQGAAAVGGVRREAHLVVHDHVQRAAHREVGHAGHLDGLVHHALPREGRVAVQQHRHVLQLVLGAVPGEELLGADLADHHGVHGLQVRRVGHQRQVHPAAVRVGAVHGGAQVVLHVAR
mmetsp:Transcript_12259/g.16810  ORF Transcript_12259/g.16810 Transcript_12259/m.16810 type:complete len:727 (-) Transcript_12259:1120-3300(-)